MREKGGSSKSGHWLVACACPFRDAGASECEKLRSAEQAKRNDVRCDDARHSSCFYYFVLTNRNRDRQLKEERPDDYHNRPGTIVCLHSPDEVRDAG